MKYLQLYASACLLVTFWAADKVVDHSLARVLLVCGAMKFDMKQYKCNTMEWEN